ncbi:MAG: hypothetical protein V1646_05290 [bacterium]
MKVNIKILIMATGFATISGLVAPQSAAGLITAQTVATTTPIDPDLKIYEAIRGLGFTDTAPIKIPDNADANLASYIDILTKALVFYTADGNAATAVQPYYGNIKAWFDAVNLRKTAIETTAGLQTAAKTTLTDAIGTTDLATLNTKLSDANISTQFTWLKTNAPTELTNFYAKIGTVYKGLASQTKDSLGAYLDSLKTISNSITTNTTVFGDQATLKGYAASVAANADTAKTVVNIMNANLSTLDSLKTAIETNGAAVKAWRKLKASIPQ